MIVVAHVLDRIAPKAGSPPSRTWTDGAGQSLAVFGPNERTGRPANAASFVDVEFPVAVSEQITVGAPGANLYRDSGIFRIIIAAKRNTGTDQALAWAKEFADLFRAKEFDGVRTFAPNPPTMDESNDNGAYFLVIVAVPYDFDFFG